jgi:YesN/AraC family two-component response regulator
VKDLLYDNKAGTFSVSYREALSHHMPASHFHDNYEIYCLLSGNRTFFIKDRTIMISQGDIVIISPNVLHRTTDSDKPKHKKLIANIHKSIMASANDSYSAIWQPLFERDYWIIRSFQYDQAAIEAHSYGIIQEVKEEKPGFECYVQTQVLQLLITCCRCIKQTSMEPLISPSPMHERISEIVRYINSHYMDNLTLHLLAEKFFVSPYYLSRFFKEATGFTFVEYLNSVRIKEAKKLLEGSSIKVNQIARNVGFGSVTHFGRMFKSLTGQTPLYFRKD